jgi:hypothetical protein
VMLPSAYRQWITQSEHSLIPRWAIGETLVTASVDPRCVLSRT